MKKILIIGAIATALSGCSTTEIITGGNPERPSDRCGYIGCATGGLVHYPHEENAAVVYPQRWHGWDWGKTSSAHPVGSPEYNRLKKQECDRARTMGLDCQGRPLYTN